jgi:hypothetical protein
MATQPIFDDVKPWPEQKAENPRAVIGGNQPPIEERIPAEFREALIGEQADFYVKLDDLLGVGDRNSEGYKTGSVDRAKCTDADELARCGVLVNILRKAAQRVDKVHKEQKQPHLDAGRLVDAQKNALVARLNGAQLHVEGLQKEYQREQNRLADVERQRLADLQAIEDQRVADEQAKIDAQRAKLEEVAKENGLEDALPPAPPPVERQTFFEPAAPRGPIRTDGATVSTGLEWLIKDVDVVKAIKHVKTNTKVIEAVKAAVKALVKSTGNNAGKGYAGVDADQDVKVSNR